MPALKVWDGSTWQTATGQGAPGVPGVGVPTGGTAGQLLMKYSTLSDYVSAWTTPIQSGIIVVTTDTAGNAAIGYPVPFITRPAVICQETSGISSHARCLDQYSTTSYFYVNVVNPTTGAAINGQVRIYWIAHEKVI